MEHTVSPITSRSNVHVSGRGEQTIVLLHGLGCNQHLWRTLRPTFEAHYRVVLLDLVGCGETSPANYDPERYGDLSGHATDLLDVLAALDLREVIFVGHSVGAMIGVIAAVREPERFAQMVLVSPSPRFLNGRDYTGGYERADLEALLTALEVDQAGWSEAFASVVVGDDGRPDLLTAFSGSFAATNPGVLQHFARVAFFADCRDQLPLLGTPTLIVQAARDVLAPLGVGYYLYEQLPDSQIAIIDTGGHCPHLTAPAGTLAAMSRFLGRELRLVPPPALPVTVPVARGPQAGPAAAAGLPPVATVPPSLSGRAIAAN